MTFQFKIELKDVGKPAVWRTVRVPGGYSFLKFHKVIQAAFGWEDDQLFQFSPAIIGRGNDFEISIPEDGDWDGGEIQDASKILLSRVFKEEGQKLLYIYDFGDNWEHEITLEKILAEEINSAECLAGKGLHPPEDCGGAMRYQEMKKALANPAHPEHNEFKEWLEVEEGEEWNPEAFNLAKAQARVKAV